MSQPSFLFFFAFGSIHFPLQCLCRCFSCEKKSQISLQFFLFSYVELSNFIRIPYANLYPQLSQKFTFLSLLVIAICYLILDILFSFLKPTMASFSTDEFLFPFNAYCINLIFLILPVLLYFVCLTVYFKEHNHLIEFSLLIIQCRYIYS